MQIIAFVHVRPCQAGGLKLWDDAHMGQQKGGQKQPKPLRVTLERSNAPDAQKHLSATAEYKWGMGDARHLDLEVRFILVPDPQALTRLLPLVGSLALSEPIEKDEDLEDKEGSENNGELS